MVMIDSYKKVLLVVAFPCFLILVFTFMPMDLDDTTILAGYDSTTSYASSKEQLALLSSAMKEAAGESKKEQEVATGDPNIAVGSLGSPLAGYPVSQLKMTSPWNPYRKHPVYGVVKPHRGIDLVPAGSSAHPPVVAVLPGRVTTTAYQAGGAGEYVAIEHANGAVTRYFHMERNSTAVSVGQEVKAGDKLGIMGNTGVGTGAHIHLEYWPNGLSGGSVNPKSYLEINGTIQ